MTFCSLTSKTPSAYGVDGANPSKRLLRKDRYEKMSNV